ncbi:UBP-type zinc finger domain-containing protein [Mycolicibacterium baixiangningiae]|uniref:UBP-type zinc finger domain-containing protein n=1 Tax=Mycolicibacterium baixiangningiae TaxID=2761578 RepID=UPI0018D0C9DD|nr:UBP-type zinc finger domain-containing protein [Mycolicibacterium baixiangningiae]
MRSRARRATRRAHDTATPPGCEHLAADNADRQPITPARCEGCAETGELTWAHLRLCITCGYVGCCDSSPHQHATEHFRTTGHPVMRSAEPGESWRWCYIDLRVG